MRKIIIIVTLALATLWASAAFATPFTITYTADNSLTGFTYSENGGAAIDVPGFVDEGTTGTWKTPASLTLDMNVGSSYQLVWTVQNYAGSGDNPMAFLADISGLFGSASTSALWEVAYDDGSGNAVGWTSASEYALNSGAWLTGASGNSIWYTGNGNSAISGISGDAVWIGYGAYPGTAASSTMYVRLTYTATPLPAAVWMFGAGLVGLLGVGRKRLRG
ncbi:MAG: hypothetical protein AB7E32_07405 [Desulfovibrio sp.]